MLQQAMKILNKMLPEHCKWFIAGGALANPTDDSDVDVYFYDKDSYEVADMIFMQKTENPIGTEVVFCYSSSKYATSYNYCKNNHGIFSGLRTGTKFSFQLIKKEFGTPKQITSKFDFNVCRAAINSNGTKYVHPTANKPFYIDYDQVTSTSFNRYFKYAVVKKYDMKYSQLYPFMNYILDNLDRTYETAYDDNQDITAYQGLKLLTSSLPTEPKLTKLIVDHINSRIKGVSQKIQRQVYKNVAFRYTTNLKDYPIQAQIIAYLYLKRCGHFDKSSTDNFFVEYYDPNNIFDIEVIKKEYPEVLL